MAQSPLLKILPPLWLLIFLGLGLLAHYLAPAAQVFDVSNYFLGVGVFAAGIALSVWPAVLFRQERTELEPTSQTNRVLIVRGPYRFSRNPMYLGGIVALLGAALFVGTLPLFLATLAQLLVLNFVFVPFEEEKMARQFGEQFESYRRRVRRWM